MFGLEPLHLAIVAVFTAVSLALVNGVFRSYRSESEPADLAGDPILKQGSPGLYEPRGFEALGLQVDATPDDIAAARWKFTLTTAATLRNSLSYSRTLNSRWHTLSGDSLHPSKR